MNTNSYLLNVGPVEALVVRKPIKNVHLSVLPPQGKVRVTAPISMKDDAIRILLATRLRWIDKQKAKFRNQQRQTAREYVSGESHYLFGRRYRLEVRYDNQPPRVEVKSNGTLVLYVRPEASRVKREEVITEWYRNELRKALTNMMAKWQDRIGVRVAVWGIKRMRTRWGTCNHDAGRILLNLELAKKPVSCIEYVVVHELIHLLEKRHTDRFAKLMTCYIPKWRSEKQELNRFILSHQQWSY